MLCRRTIIICLLFILGALTLRAPHTAHGAVPHQVSETATATAIPSLDPSTFNPSQLALPLSVLPAGSIAVDGPSLITSSNCTPATTGGIVDEFLIEHVGWCDPTLGAAAGIYQDWTLDQSPAYVGEWAATVYSNPDTAYTAAGSMLYLALVPPSPINNDLICAAIVDTCADGVFTDPNSAAPRPNVLYGVIVTSNVVGEAAVAYGSNQDQAAAAADLNAILTAGDAKINAALGTQPASDTPTGTLTSTATGVATVMGTPATSTATLGTSTATSTATPIATIGTLVPTAILTATSTEGTPIPPPPLPTERITFTATPVTPTVTLTPTATATVTPTATSTPSATPTATATAVVETDTPTPRPTTAAKPVVFRVYGADLQTNWTPNWGQSGKLATAIKRGQQAIFGIYVSVHKIPHLSKIQFGWTIRSGTKLVAHHGHYWITSAAIPYWDHWAYTLKTPGTYRFTGTVVIGGVRHHRSLVFHVTG